jgi:hypothetical protein
LALLDRITIISQQDIKVSAELVNRGGQVSPIPFGFKFGRLPRAIYRVVMTAARADIMARAKERSSVALAPFPGQNVDFGPVFL